LRRLDEFGPIHLFSLCWAYSTARLLDEDLQSRITKAALKLGEARDASPHPRSKRGRPREGEGEEANVASAGGAEEEAIVEPQGVQQGQKWYEEPSILAEGEHWLALYKPPHWEVSVDSKEAAKAAERAAAAAPFEDDDEGEGDGEEAGPEQSRNKLKLHSWIRQHMAAKYPICTDPIEAFGLMHRLDAQTSGVLMCAKSYVGAYWLRLQWCSYAVDKEYVSLVHGWVDRDIREIHKRIRIDKKKAPNSRRTISTICSVGPNGKPSFTEVCTLAHLTRPATTAGSEGQVAEPERFSLVVLKLHTGRTHQIRVHMQAIGHPLVCDSKYAVEKQQADSQWCPRNFLHTFHLGFNDTPPRENLGGSATEGEPAALSGPPVDLLCPLPADLRAVLAELQPADDASAAHHADWITGEAAKMRTFEEYLPPQASE